MSFCTSTPFGHVASGEHMAPSIQSSPGIFVSDSLALSTWCHSSLINPVLIFRNEWSSHFLDRKSSLDRRFELDQLYDNQMKFLGRSHNLCLHIFTWWFDNHVTSLNLKTLIAWINAQRLVLVHESKNYPKTPCFAISKVIHQTHPSRHVTALLTEIYWQLLGHSQSPPVWSWLCPHTHKMPHITAW